MRRYEGAARRNLSRPDSLRLPFKRRRDERSFYLQIRQARFWLPVIIVGVVLFHQLVTVPLGGPSWRFWSQLLFYSILGPVVTYLTLDWIASEVRQREAAQTELKSLYDELRASHALLGAIQKVTEQFALAADLEAVLSAASRGVTEVTGAVGCAVLVGPQGTSVSRSYGLNGTLAKHAASRDMAMAAEVEFDERVRLEAKDYWVLSAPLVWAGKFEGSIHCYFDTTPGPEQRESFSILSSEFSAAAEATRSRTRDMLTLFEVDRSIRAEGNLERLLETLLSQTMLRAEAALGGVYLADEDGLLHLHAWRGLDLTSPPPLKVGEGFVGESAASLEHRVAQQLSEVELRSAGPVLEGAASAVALPLIEDEGLLGMILLAHPEQGHFKEANLPFLSLLAGQVTLAVRNAQAYLQSEELAIAEERARIAREIHDGVAQSLAFSALKLDLVERLAQEAPKKAHAELAEVKRTVRETIKEMRRSIFALRPIDLERHGFAETIRRYTYDYGQQNGIQLEFDLGQVPKLTAKSEAVLFRIFQEAMNNVAKHAGACSVEVKVGTTAEGRGFISVRDDGCGFDPERVSDRVTSAGGLGLRQMRERVEARGGVFRVEAEPGRGTRVYAAVPE